MEKNVLKFSEVSINGMTLHTEFLYHRLLKQDVKILLLTEYINNSLNFRKQLTITNYEKDINLNIGDMVILNAATDKINKYKISIGKAKVKKINNNSIVVKPYEIIIDNKLSANIDDMFCPLESRIINVKYLEKEYPSVFDEYKKRYNNYLNKLDKKKYINGLFKTYYDSIIQYFKDNSNYYSISKVTAMSSYLNAKKYFEDKDKIVSNPNVFIKDFHLEFDLLLLKKGVNKRKFIFNLDEVEAIVELKSNGIIGYGNKDTKKDKAYNNKRWFEAYVTFDNDYKKREMSLKNYDELLKNKTVSTNYRNLKERVQKIDYIFFCLYEKNYVRSATYENTYFDLLATGKTHKGIYFGISNGDKYVIPIDY